LLRISRLDADSNRYLSDHTRLEQWIPLLAWWLSGRLEPPDSFPYKEVLMTLDHNEAHYARLQKSARDHLWLHFTRMSTYQNADVPLIVRGDGVYVYDARGKRYLDGLASLFTSQVGHGRTEIAEAAAKQASELAFFPLWSYAHPNAIELAERLTVYAPGDLNRIFFTSGGGEAVESAWKLAKQYFKLTGKPGKHKVISRAIAYHGTPQGALSITGLPGLKAPFEPLVPSTFRVPNTNIYRAPIHGDDPEAFGRWAADQIDVAIENEGADTVAAVFLEPVQNAGGCFPPPPGYFERVREICDEQDVLLVSDEVICAFGRLGHYFGAERYGYVPDIIICAKGLTSGYAPLGAMLTTDRLMEPFLQGSNMFAHGYTFGGHPVSTAVALANLDIFEREQLNEHVLATQNAFRATLEKLLDLPIVGDVRGDGYFYGIEMVKDKATKATFDDDESERLLRGFLDNALFDAGLYCRADDRGDPVIQLSPPLICDQEHFDTMEQILRSVLTEAWTRL
jgi:adenosylmethionine-8-amino-7-oxononanoate aminotransferase